MHRGIVSLVLSICLAATAARAQPAPPAKVPDTKSPPPPMVFYVAKGEPGACGPGCQEWIAAEGFIDPNAGPRLWELLRKIGNDRKPPVYFHSGGGSVSAALEIGRLMRARGFKAGVGVTVPAKCDGRNPADAACEALKRSGRELPAELDTLAGVCASACVYTVLGGTVRDVRAGARLGIHDTYSPPTIRRFDETGHLVDEPWVRSGEAVRRGHEATQSLIGRYLREMGISPDLLTAAQGIGPDKLHVLTRAQIVAFGIDRRERVESTWSPVDKPVSAVKVVEATDGHVFRTATLNVTCRNAATVRLVYMHEVGGEADGAPAALRLTAGARSFPLKRLGSAAQDGNRPRFEGHGAELPLATLDAAAFVIESNTPSGESSDSPAAASARVAVEGAAPALAALARRCASGTQ
jgi:hypothetical protein